MLHNMSFLLNDGMFLIVVILMTFLLIGYIAYIVERSQVYNLGLTEMIMTY